MSYALATLWHERQRFLPGVFAVAFSALLIALQCGLLLGMFSITSLPIDMSSADIWVGPPQVSSVDLPDSIPESSISYLAYSEIVQIEPFLEKFALWRRTTGGVETCLVIGSRLGSNSLGAVQQLTPELRDRLSEPGSIVVDEGEFERLGITGVGDIAEIGGKRVRVVGTVSGMRSLAGPYLFCSLDTAYSLVNLPPNQVTFLLAKCRDKRDAERIVEQLQEYPLKISAFTSEQFSFRSRMHWLTKTKAGIALGLAAALGLLVGAVVTYQTLYAATAASLKEYAVLRALGIPRWRMGLAVLSQSFWVGAAGVAVSLPTIYLMASFGNDLGAKVQLPWWLLVLAVTITMLMAMASGILALRSLRAIEPVNLLR